MASTEKLKRTFDKFEKALGKYKEIVKSKKTFASLNQEWVIEIATKRFEYTFESLWQCLREYLRLEGIECATPLACLKHAFAAGLIEKKYESLCAEMVEKRNQIVHVYDAAQAQAIYEFIKDHRVCAALEGIYKKIKPKID